MMPCGLIIQYLIRVIIKKPVLAVNAVTVREILMSKLSL